MTFRDEPVEASEPHHRQSTENVSRRLDALSQGDAERVLERAIRIHDEGQRPDQMIDRDRLYRVAEELGIDAGVVDRALREEVSSRRASKAATRFLAPVRVSSRAAVPGDASDVADRVTAWMTRDEGLRPAAATGEGIRWAPETNWKTTARLAVAGRGTKALRGLSGVEHRQIEVAADEQVVEIEADTRRIGTVAASIGASVMGGALVGGIGAAAGLAGGNDVVQFLMVAAPGAALAIGTTIGVAKIWTMNIRKGIERALEGIVAPGIVGTSGASGSRPGGVRRLIKEVVELLESGSDRRGGRQG